MKRCLLLIVLLAVVVGTAGATQLTFSKARDVANTTINVTPGAPWSWGGYGAGLNGYFYNGQTGGYGFTLTNPLATTYAAATIMPSSSYAVVRLYTNSEKTAYVDYNYLVPSFCSGRAEMVVSGGKAYFYCNGMYHGNTTMSTNPLYVAWRFGNLDQFASMQTDDYTYGSDEIREVIGMPDGEVYALQKDFVTGAAGGMLWTANGTTANSTYLPVTFSRGNATAGMTNGEPLTNKSMCLKHVTSDTCYQYQYTGTANYGTVNFDLATFMAPATGAPFGYYKVTLQDSEAVSDQIAYLSTGATITFDGDSYSQGDTATITYTIEDDYFLPGTYDYSIKVYDGGTFETKQTNTISLQNGSTTYAFSNTDDAGVYYAVLIATDRTTHAENWFALDWADLDAYVTFYGYAMNETGSVLSGANVSITQGDLVSNSVTIADGNYTATGFYAGAATTLNVTASGYSQYRVVLTPLAARRIPLNFTLNSTTPAVTGLGIGGVARDGIFNDTTRVITSGYGRPLSDATVYLWNFSNNEGYTRTTNIAGWYLCDEGASCTLTPGRIYDVQGRKTGYNHSVNYTVVTT